MSETISHYKQNKGQLISKGLQIYQKTNNMYLRISALASKKRSDHQKNKGKFIMSVKLYCV
jgi:hypothetical protein